MNFDIYLLAGFEVLKNTTVTISGYSAIDAIFDNAGFSHEKDMTFQEDFEIPIKVRSADLPVAKKSVIGKHVTIQLDGNTYRIDRMKVGSATTFLFLNSKERI